MALKPQKICGLYVETAFIPTLGTNLLLLCYIAIFIGHHLAVYTTVKPHVIMELIPDGVLNSYTKLFTLAKGTFFLNIYCFVIRIEMILWHVSPMQSWRVLPPLPSPRFAPRNCV
jgi:uncharacterized membrane protein YGL010W